MSDAPVTPGPDSEDDGLEQLGFEGFAVDLHRLGLQSAANLPTGRRLTIDQEVKGRFIGTVRHIHMDRTRDGKLVRRQLVEVLEVELD